MLSRNQRGRGPVLPEVSPLAPKHLPTPVRCIWVDLHSSALINCSLQSCYSQWLKCIDSENTQQHGKHSTAQRTQGNIDPPPSATYTHRHHHHHLNYLFLVCSFRNTIQVDIHAVIPLAALLLPLVTICINGVYIFLQCQHVCTLTVHSIGQRIKTEWRHQSLTVMKRRVNESMRDQTVELVMYTQYIFHLQVNKCPLSVRSDSLSMLFVVQSLSQHTFVYTVTLPDCNLVWLVFVS